jgi:glucosamine 6-phosphate synthetase-like amidotransferase/phosphosugar isomerase protein
MMRTVRIFIISVAMLAGAVIGVAQTSEPTPVTLQAATPAPAEDAKQQAEMAENIKQLQELKAQNDEILKQQQAALDALDELQKDAEQIRIYSKRG